jgi:hypothetical protein
MSLPKKPPRTTSPNSPFFQSAFNELDDSRANSMFANTETPSVLTEETGDAPRQPADLTNRMGQAFIAAKKLTEDEVIRIIQLQQRKRIRFGEAAIKLGLLSEEDVHEVLAQQFNYQTIAKHGDGSKKRISSRLLISHSPYSAQAEAIRRFRSEIMLRAGEQPCLVIALTSPNAKEGKSHLSASLAIAFAQLNLKTLLLDANLRKPSLHQLFDVSNKTGLSTMLAGRTLPTLDMSHAITNFLHVIPSGPKPPNPSEILSAPNLSELLGQVQARGQGHHHRHAADPRRGRCTDHRSPGWQRHPRLSQGPDHSRQSARGLREHRHRVSQDIGHIFQHGARCTGPDGRSNQAMVGAIGHDSSLQRLTCTSQPHLPV